MKAKLSVLSLLPFILFACSMAPNNALVVEVSRERYNPLIDKSKHSEYAGQTMIFDSVDVSEDPNITNFYYLSPDKSIGYTLFYSESSMQQPVASFFWYSMEKTFQSLGMTITAETILKNVPRLHLKILTLTDQDAKFQVSLSRNGLLLMQKDISVSQELPQTNDRQELERRQYTYLDKMVDTILSDPDFKREFFSEKGRI